MRIHVRQLVSDSLSACSGFSLASPSTREATLSCWRRRPASSRSRGEKRLVVDGKSSSRKWAMRAHPHVAAPWTICDDASVSHWKRADIVGTHEKPFPSTNAMHTIKPTSDSTGKDATKSTRKNSCRYVYGKSLGLFVSLVP